MRNKILLSFVLIIVTIGVFFQTTNHQFINFDDPGYVTKNPVVKGGLTAAGVAWAFTSTAMSNWHPVTWLSHMLDVQMFGLDPAGHHLVSVLLHALAALLLFLLLENLTGAVWPSIAVAALFALHPLHVESVAWVAERKDVLSCMFWLLTLILYAGHVKRGGYRFYLLSLLTFVIGLMTKPMLVTLPLVMLLMDFWPLNRMTGEGPHKGRFLALFKEKAPFFLFSGLSAVITIYGQHKGGAMATLDKVPFFARIENALISYVKYIVLMVWPHDLAILYPFPKVVPLWQAVGSGIILVAISVVVIRYRSRFPYLVTGWFWYLFTLLPVIGLVQVGGQALADRYTYIPLTGLFIAICWLLSDVTRGWRRREAILSILSALVISLLTAVTWRQIGYWKDDLTLYRHTLAVTSDNYLILNNFGIALDESGDLAGAYGMFQETLRINPRSATAYNNLGALFVRWGNYPAAVESYSRAIEINPGYAFARSGMGKALAGLGRVAEAIREYEEALRNDPGMAETHQNLAILMMKSGRRDEAMVHFDAALRLDPASAKAPINMGAELAKGGKIEESLEYFNLAVSIDPNSVEAHFNRGVALAKLGRIDEAMAEFSRVLELKPDTYAARNWLERLRQGR
jgi:tetratricopeptide (TPR) repeat protein